MHVCERLHSTDYSSQQYDHAKIETIAFLLRYRFNAETRLHNMLIGDIHIQDPAGLVGV